MKKVTITGLTEATLTFNTLGILLHGEKSAENLLIDSPDQEQEIIGLVSAGFIKTEFTEGDDVSPIDNIATSVNREEPDQEEAAKEEPAKEEPSKEKKTKRRGRPKGSKNRQTAQRKKPRGSKPKKISRKSPEPEDGHDSDAIIMTPEGAKTGKAHKEMDKEPEEPTDKTAESIETMKRLEEEEAEALKKAFLGESDIDEESLDPSERSGQEAVVSTGKEASKKQMTRSAVPDSDIALNRDPFIDRNDDSKDNIEDVFIDEPVDDDNDDIIEL